MSHLGKSGDDCATLKFNPFDPGYQKDPYSVLARLRREDPAFETNLGFRLLTRHEDVDSVLRSPDFVLADDAGSRRFAKGSAIARVCSDAFLFHNPPRHTKLRGFVGRGFSQSQVRGLRDSMRNCAVEQLSRLDAEGQVDLVSAFAKPLPLNTICDLVGIAIDDRERVAAWSESLCPTLDPIVSPETVVQLSAAVDEFGEFVLSQAYARIRKPQPDLLTVLSKAWAREEVSSGELVASCVLLLAAGHETTSNLIASGLVSLLRNPHQLQRLRMHRELLSGAVEEMLRTESPIQMFLRWARVDCVIGDAEISAGDTVAVHIGAANRDPLVFDRCNEFDITRQNNRHLAFGAGIHFCVGSALARAEAESALAGVIDIFDEINLVEVPDWKETVTVRGPKQVVVRYRKRSRK